MWRETTQHERNRRIFEEEFEAFLPPRILDFHVHVFPSETLPPGETYCCAGHAIHRYDLADLDRDLAQTYPARKTFAVCFGLPSVNYDRKANDGYLARNCDGRRFFPFRLFDPAEDRPDSLRRDIEKQGFLGIKPYLDYVRKGDPNEVEIREMVPDWCMEIVNHCGLIVMLHIPRKQRLADLRNQRQLVEICETYPRARIVLAHVGRAYFLKNVAGNLDLLKSLPNLYFDIAMLNHWEVLEYLFQQVPGDRVLYATDTPIALAPGKSVEINDQYTYVTPVPWELSIADDRGRVVFTSFLYEELRAIKKAVERLKLARPFVEGLFYQNGTNLLRSVPRSTLSRGLTGTVTE